MGAENSGSAQDDAGLPAAAREGMVSQSIRAAGAAKTVDQVVNTRNIEFRLVNWMRLVYGSSPDWRSLADLSPQLQRSSPSRSALQQKFQKWDFQSEM
jgi:hypothetical protein